MTILIDQHYQGPLFSMQTVVKHSRTSNHPAVTLAPGEAEACLSENQALSEGRFCCDMNSNTRF